MLKQVQHDDSCLMTAKQQMTQRRDCENTANRQTLQGDDFLEQATTILQHDLVLIVPDGLGRQDGGNLLQLGMERILSFDELDSTNTYLKTHCTEWPDKTVVTAERQTAGRGRYDRKWVSQAGGLYFSVLIKPQSTDFLPNFTQLMALCVCNAAKKLGANAWLKWPNDVLADGKKLCGILSEAVLAGGKVEGLVIGVGVNVAQEDLSHVGQPAVSLKELGISVNKTDFLRQVLALFWQGYPALQTRGFAAIKDEYKKNFAYLGKQISVKDGEKTLFGTVEDVSPAGTLLLSTANGPEEIYIGDLIV